MSISSYNQIVMPEIMYGTAWKKQDTTRFVKAAIEAGYRGIDTANQLIHYDEALVGKALQEACEQGHKREDFFLQTKFTSISGQGDKLPYDRSASLRDQVKQSFASSLEHLHTNYIDSYVLHGPTFRKGLVEEDWEIWRAIEEIYESGAVKVIGVSNVGADQLASLCSLAKVKPMIVQNRCYAILGWDEEVRRICLGEDIIYQGFSLLTANSQVLNASYVNSIATRLSCTPQQVIFRFAFQIGMQPITGTTSSKHMLDDLKALELNLSDEEMERLEGIAVRA